MTFPDSRKTGLYTQVLILGARLVLVSSRWSPALQSFDVSFPIICRFGRSALVLKLMPLWKMFLRDQFHFGICFCLFECQNPEIEKMRPATAIGALKAAAEEQFSQH